ncbi:hypothetical protein AB0454_22480 [Streptomyces sp. NPDC093509]|uniref:hypothetical protein n=1 Tax=Streptomyces sp. NPDC093509 TaxID=3154982 RepID=UPI00344E950D
MTNPVPKTAMTMREIRHQLGHPVPPPGVPDAEVLPVRFVVSSVPEGHNARHAYTINVHYRGEGMYSVGHGLAYADGDGAWSYEPSRSGEDDEHDADGLTWIAAHRFELTTALRLARRLAPTLTVRGRSVADVLADGSPTAEGTQR